MRNSTVNQIRMISTTLQTCTDHAADVAGIAAFAALKTAADNKRILIGQLTVIAEGTTGGVTLDTKALRKTMCDIALKCGDAVSAYAASVGNNTLRDKVTYTLPVLDRMGKETVLDICQGIHDEANNNIVAAGPFGYVLADVTDLLTAINLYGTASENPRQAIITKKTAIANMEAIVRDVIDNLFKRQMDRMVNTLKATKPDFVSGYYSSREIIDLGTTTAKVRGKVTTEQDAPIANVQFTVYNAGTTTIVKQVITNAEGRYNATKIPAGDYDFKWELNGFKPVNDYGVHISSGKEMNRNIKLQPGGLSATLEADVPATSIMNVPVNNLNIKDDSTMRLEVTGSTLRFYASASNVGAPGAQFFEMAPGQIFTKTVLDWINVFGFDEQIEDFLNVQNTGAVQGHYKMKWENLGPNN